MFAPILGILIKIIVIAFVFSFLILAHELGHFMAARRSGVRVKRFSLGFGPEIVGFQRGHTRYSISAIPFGGYVKMAGEDPREKLLGQPWEYLAQPVGRRLAIVGAGPISNYLLAFLIFTLVFFAWGNPSKTTQIGGLLEEFPAQVHGLKQGDWIMAIDDEPVETWEQMAEVIHKKHEGSIVLKVRRDRQEFSMTITPKVEAAKDVTGKETKFGIIGITPVIRKYAPLKALISAGDSLLTLTGLTYKGIFMLVTGRVDFRRSLIGPLGIIAITGQMAKLGPVNLLHFMAMLSMALAIFNFLPIPILDGGNIIFLALERLRRRPLSVNVQESIQQVTFILLIVLILFVSYNDIIKYWLRK